MSLDIIRAEERIEVPCYCEAIHGIMSVEILYAPKSA